MKIPEDIQKIKRKNM